MRSHQQYTLLQFVVKLQYAYQRKKFKGYRNITPEPFEMKKHNFINYGPSNSGKTTFIKDFCCLFVTVNVFCYHEEEWDRCIVYGDNDLKLLNNLENFANSLIIFDDMRDNIRIPVIDTLYSRGRH